MAKQSQILLCIYAALEEVTQEQTKDEASRQRGKGKRRRVAKLAAWLTIISAIVAISAAAVRLGEISIGGEVSIRVK